MLELHDDVVFLSICHSIAVYLYKNQSLKSDVIQCFYRLASVQCLYVQ